MALCNFANFKLILSRHRKELRGAPKSAGPRPIWPMRKSVSAYGARSCKSEHWQVR